MLSTSTTTGGEVVMVDILISMAGGIPFRCLLVLLTQATTDQFASVSVNSSNWSLL